MRNMLARILWGLLALLFMGAAGVSLPQSIEHSTQEHSTQEHSTQTILPALTGRFQVGRASFDWIDESRVDPFAMQPGTKRELTVWIWYPAAVKKSSTPSEYIPANWRAALAQRQSPAANKMWRDPSLVHCHSFNDVGVARDQRTYPIVLMKPGVGALALDYTTVCEDLASHGYIVVASDSPYNTLLVVYQDGRVALRNSAAFPGESNSTRMIGIWTSDNRFLLDRLNQLNQHDLTGRFQGRLNLNKVGVMGHSFGGATAAEFCHKDPRCQAGIDLDGQLFGEVTTTGVNRPFMYLMADHSGAMSAEDRQVLAKIRSTYDLSSPGRQYVTLRGAGHFNFSDKCLLVTGPMVRNPDTIGAIDERQGLRAATACIRAFFDVNLKGAAPAIMERIPMQYPELLFESDKS